MGLKSASVRLAARLQSQAAVRLKPFALADQFKMVAGDFIHRFMAGVAPIARIKPLLLLFVAALWGLPLRGADDATANQYEAPPLQPGSIEWQIDQHAARESQELCRQRMALPDAVGGTVTRSAMASLINGPKVVAAPPLPPAVSFGILLKTFAFLMAFALTGVLIVRGFAPRILVDVHQRFNPYAPAPVAGRERLARVRAEEEAFARFLKSFRVGPVVPPDADRSGNNEPVSDIFARLKKRLEAQRKLFQEIGLESSDSVRHRLLTNLCLEMGLVKGEAGVPEALPVWQAASALEGLLKQLTEKKGNVTPSTLRTVAGGLDLLEDLCAPGVPPNLLPDHGLKFLVVDDDPISRQALSRSLHEVFSQPDVAVDGQTALAQASQLAYDVIFLDVQLPGMDGFELCTKIRGSVLNCATPVVFVTVLSDFDARCKSTLSGGNELMGKPFLTFEITVKALTLALQGRLHGRTRKPFPQVCRGRNAGDMPVTTFAHPRAVPNPIPVSRLLFSTLLPPVMGELTQAFLDRVVKQLGPLQELGQAMRQAPDADARQTMLVDGFLRMNSLLPRPAPEVRHPAYQMSAALEGLFRKMLEDSKHVTPSALATVANAVDLLNELCVPGIKMDLAVQPPIRLLVVDDDLVARRALVGALQTAFEKPENAESGETALALATEKPYDVIFLDVVMPGMDGFEVCAKIRNTVANRATPVVFVTGRGDEDAHARMNQSGGNDMMEKTFLTPEITTKALTLALRARLQSAGQFQN